MQTRRRVAGALALVWLVVIFIFSAIPGESYPAHPGFLNYLAHFGEYMILSALLTTALFGGKLKAWQAVLIAVLLSSAYAASDEIHQLFVPGRMSDPVDWITDTLGALVAAPLTAFVLTRLDSKVSASPRTNESSSKH